MYGVMYEFFKIAKWSILPFASAPDYTSQETLQRWIGRVSASD